MVEYMRILLALVMMMVAAFPAFAAPIKVVASFSIIGDLVKQVGGDDVEVTTLVGPDGDAHVFQPSPADGKKIADASIVFMNGLGFEGWMERLIASTEYKGKVVVVSDGIGMPLMTEDEDHKEDGHKDHGHKERGHKERGHKKHDKHAHGAMDPHAWQNIANGRTYVKNIAKALSAANPVNAARFTANAEALDMDLAGLDAWVNNEIGKVQISKRKVICSHDAFGYFAKAYGIHFMAPVGVSTEAEPSAKGMAHLVEQIKQNGVRAIFFESMASSKIVQQLAAEAGATVGPALYADALSPASGPASTYQAMFKHNTTKLVEAMQLNQ